METNAWSTKRVTAVGGDKEADIDKPVSGSVRLRWIARTKTHLKARLWSENTSLADCRE